jgi:hypothetical protein
MIFFRKPVPTFQDHALAATAFSIVAVALARQGRFATLDPAISDGRASRML